jgi:hypothetical protein
MKKEDNTVNELQNMMFTQMRLLADSNSDLDKEIKRAQALSSAGNVIINAAKVQLQAARIAKQAKPGKEVKQVAGSKSTKQLENGK